MLGVTEVILKMWNLFLCYHQKYCFNCGLMKGGQKKKDWTYYVILDLCQVKYQCNYNVLNKQYGSNKRNWMKKMSYHTFHSKATSKIEGSCLNVFTFMFQEEIHQCHQNNIIYQYKLMMLNLNTLF